MPTINLQNYLVSFFEKHRFLIILLFLTFLVRLPSLFEPFWYGDEAIYLVIGQKILHGGLLYVDIFDHKTPGIYYLAAAALGVLGQTIWSWKFLLMIWTLVTLVVFYILGKRLFDDKVAKIATVALAALTATPFLEGNIGNSEILMILPISLGLIFGLKKSYFWSGVFFSLAFLLKFPAVFDFGAFFIFLLVGANRKTFSTTLKNLFYLVAGYLLPIALSVLYFVSKGAFSAYLYSALLFNFSYTNYGNQLNLGGLVIPNGLILLKGLPLLGLTIYLLWRLYVNFKSSKVTVSNSTLILLWLIFAYYGAVFGGRPYPHYLIQALPAFSLLIALGLSRRLKPILVWGISGFIVVLSVLLGFKPWTPPTYYANFFRYISGKMSNQEYLDSFDSKTSRNYSLAAYIKSRTSSSDNFYIWGNSPVIYFLAQRDPTSKYITEFHIAGNPLFKNQTLDAVKARKPRYVLVEESSPDWPELDIVLGSSYNLFAQSNDVKIYRLVGSSPTD